MPDHLHRITDVTLHSALAAWAVSAVLLGLTAQAAVKGY